MNVSGFRSSRRRKSISASARSPSNLRAKVAPEPPLARRSTASKPMLCRVPSYLLPGLPRPTTSFLMADGPILASSRRLLLLLLVLVLGLPPDHFRLDRGRALGRVGRGARGGHVGDRQLGVDVGRHALGQLQVADVDGLVQVQVADVDPDR